MDRPARRVGDQRETGTRGAAADPGARAAPDGELPAQLSKGRGVSENPFGRAAEDPFEAGHCRYRSSDEYLIRERRSHKARGNSHSAEANRRTVAPSIDRVPDSG